MKWNQIFKAEHTRHEEMHAESEIRHQARRANELRQNQSSAETPPPLKELQLPGRGGILGLLRTYGQKIAWT